MRFMILSLLKSKMWYRLSPIVLKISKSQTLNLLKYFQNLKCKKRLRRIDRNKRKNLMMMRIMNQKKVKRKRMMTRERT